jgi:hypothetical protein
LQSLLAESSEKSKEGAADLIGLRLAANQRRDANGLFARSERSLLQPQKVKFITPGSHFSGRPKAGTPNPSPSQYKRDARPTASISFLWPG